MLIAGIALFWGWDGAGVFGVTMVVLLAAVDSLLGATVQERIAIRQPAN